MSTSTTGLNKIVTSVSALTDNITIPDANNVVCIDTENNRIGVKTSTPSYEIDVSGTIKTNIVKIDNANITYDNITNNLNIDSSIRINNDISCATSIRGLYVSSNLFQGNSFYGEVFNGGNFIGEGFFGSNLTAANIYGINLDIHNITSNNNNKVVFNCDVDISGTLTMDFINFIILLSDDRLKHNEKNITNGLEVIRQLNPQIYQKTRNFKQENYIGELNEPYIIEAGLIAQEVEKINDLSFSVNVGNNEKPYSLNYNNIFVYSLAALKELDLNVKNIETKINQKFSNKFSNNQNTNNENTNNENTNNENNNLEIIINNQNKLIEKLMNKIDTLENRINIIEKAF